ncbi:sensor histidine kinase [Corallococcus sp. ZKHCc1 1396]|uniref:histidine kinase n=1 Tax=Corallococcus soli TaxID=2710757 RepID=A0ABR9PL21_9BACT|nr:histidine kinase dimerization/phospho-acceptor domain-containing protein [Corallococcus soli]MBE4748601.1 sensor histidine kinase [Corallococcus soli]
MNAQLLQVAQLAWSPNLRLTRAEGDCDTVLRRAASTLVGSPLHTVLGITQERARELDARAREDRRAVEFVSTSFGGGPPPTYLRLVLGRDGDEASAGVLDLGAVLEGAPPVQISRLSSSLSHEIRNPLSSVKMAVQTLARNTGLSDRDKRRLTIANREIRTMERMLWLLSEYGREGAANLDSHPLRSVVQEATAMVAPELAERRIEVDVKEEADLPRVRVDPNRLRPVLAQVLLNVAMGLPEEGRVQVTLRQAAPGQVSLILDDPAAALPPEERGTLFDPFGSRLARGAGLSLAALRRVMTGVGGEVGAEGSAEPGMVFTLTFAA